MIPSDPVLQSLLLRIATAIQKHRSQSDVLVIRAAERDELVRLRQEALEAKQITAQMAQLSHSSNRALRRAAR